MPTPEGRVLNAVCNYLALLEHQGKLVFWRQNNGATYDAKRGVYRKPGVGQRNGVPDVMVLCQGKMIGIECKAANGKQSAAQVAFAADMHKHGGFTMWCSTLMTCNRPWPLTAFRSLRSLSRQLRLVNLYGS